MERDNNACILTKYPDPEAAYIYPYCMINNQGPSFEKVSFWYRLRTFWSASRVQEWKNEIHRDQQNPETGTEGCFNLLCLSPSAHDMWNKGIFALKPVARSEDGTTLTIQFFWQPRYSHRRTSGVDLLMEPLLSRDLNHVDGVYTLPSGLREDGQLQPIRSGDMFTLTTNDPDKKPLPSFKLLELQWILQRVVAMSGICCESSFDYSSDRVYDWIPPPQSLYSSDPPYGETGDGGPGP